MSSQNIDFKKKYLKYKEKYLALKKLADKMDANNNVSVMVGGGNETVDKVDVFLFKAEWCGHCKAFKPTWENLQNKYNNKYNFHTYDNDKNEKEMVEWEIRGFPTIIAKKGDLATEYRGPRDEESLLNFFDSL